MSPLGDLMATRIGTGVSSSVRPRRHRVTCLQAILGVCIHLPAKDKHTLLVSHTLKFNHTHLVHTLKASRTFKVCRILKVHTLKVSHTLMVS
jgi:hypothetical protein